MTDDVWSPTLDMLEDQRRKLYARQSAEYARTMRKLFVDLEEWPIHGPRSDCGDPTGAPTTLVPLSRTTARDSMTCSPLPDCWPTPTANVIPFPLNRVKRR